MRALLALLAVLAATLVATLAALALPAEADVRMCRNTFGGDVISARNVGCERARRVVRTWARRFRRDGRVNRTVLRFRCRDRSNSVEGLVVRCTRGERTIRPYANVPR